MSGIAGILYLDGRPVLPAEIVQMLSSLAHRGPDGSGKWTEGSAGLGHCMLWNTPESLQEKLPLASASGEAVITTDGRIDNREELLAELNLKDRPASETGDSELILAAYEKWGEGCSVRLIGDYAFAIWDRRKKKLFCSRDTMGVKPFYYYHAPGKVFIFASEVKGILKIPEIPRHLYELRIVEHILRIIEDRESTFYQQIRRLPAGHHLSLTSGGLVIRRYWSLDSDRELRLRSNREYEEAFREVFIEAVSCRLRSPFPVGSTLSGGLDSSSIACTARNLLASKGALPLHTFSLIFPGLPEEDLPRIDERKYIEAVVDTGGFEGHHIRGDRLNPLGELEKATWHLDEPISGPNLYLHWAMFKSAREQGIRVLLDGVDGDIAVSHGLARFSDLARGLRWGKLLQEAKDYSRNANGKSRVRKIIWHLALKPLFPPAFVDFWHAMRSGSTANELEYSAINLDFAKRLDVKKQFRAFQADFSAPFLTARRKHYLDLTSPLIPMVLEMADKTATEFHLEPRYPFYDRRLVEFCLSLPAEQKYARGWTRSILRRSMEGILPKDVQWRRSKSDLSPNYQRRLLECEIEGLEETLIRDSCRLEGYYEIGALREAYERYSTGQTQGEGDALAVFGAATLAYWLETVGAAA